MDTTNTPVPAVEMIAKIGLSILRDCLTRNGCNEIPGTTSAARYSDRWDVCQELAYYGYLTYGSPMGGGSCVCCDYDEFEITDKGRARVAPRADYIELLPRRRSRRHMNYEDGL